MRKGTKKQKVSSVSKQEQPVTTERKTAAGSLCQEKGQWEPPWRCSQSLEPTQATGKHISRTELSSGEMLLQSGKWGLGRHSLTENLFPGWVLQADVKGSQKTKAEAEEPWRGNFLLDPKSMERVARPKSKLIPSELISDPQYFPPLCLCVTHVCTCIPACEVFVAYVYACVCRHAYM